MLNKPELLMPAGSFEKLQFAFAYGADAVYAGLPFFSLRARENEFSDEKVEEAIALANTLEKKVYLTANVFAKNRKIKNFTKQIDIWAKMKPHALIMSDPGLIDIVKQKHPDIPIHLSVQANCMNYQAVKFWHKIGVERVILSRELNINEIREIKQQVPEMELEAFVHGAICIAYSGRCLMSSYFSQRDANQGVCDNSCREKFNVFAAEKTEKDYYIEDLRNKGEFYQINEDENGTYLMNAKDLNLVENLKEIAEAGVCSFKIEGRTKSLNYLSLVTKSYRKAIDDMMIDKPFDNAINEQLAKVANRGYHKGFMINKTNKDSQNYDTSVARYYSQKYAGVVKSTELPKIEGYLPIEVRNRLEVGNTLEVITPTEDNYSFKISEIKNEKGESLDVAHGGTGIKYFKTDLKAPDYSIVSQLLN